VFFQHRLASGGAKVVELWIGALLFGGDLRVADQAAGEGGLRIPTQGGQVFRSDPGHCSDLMAATIPI